MTRSLTLTLVSVALTASLLGGCAGGALGGSQVAKINSDVVTRQEFNTNYQRILKTMNLDPKLLKGKDAQPLIQMFQKITMQNLILNHLVSQEAEKRHITVTPEEVKALYAKHLTRIGGEPVLKAQLDKLKLSKEEFMTELKNQLLKDKVVLALAGNQIQVSEAEAKSFYAAHPSQFDQAEQVHARHILVSADPSQIRQDLLKKDKDMKPEAIDQAIATTLAERKVKADNLYADAVSQPQQFEILAGKSSDDVGSAKHGGDLGYFAKEAMVPEFAKAAFATKPGQIHEGVVQSQFGFHIIQVLDRKAPEKKTFDEVKPMLMEGLANQKKNHFMENWLEQAKHKAHIDLAPDFAFLKEPAPGEKAAPAPTAPTKS